jgi:glycosyltransferase involved in cell wall biosynthesis
MMADNDGTAARIVTDPAVSVVITTRNRRTLLQRSVESALAQRGPSFELVIVDDNSTDGTPAYLAQLNDPAIRAVTAPSNVGNGAACNLGLANVRAPLVMFLDDDDWLWPNALATLTSALQQNANAVAAVGARWDWFTLENYERRDAHPRLPRTVMVFDALLFGWSAVSGQVVFRTNVLRDLGGFRGDLPRCQDRDLWQRVARRGPVALRPEITMTYRWHPGQNQLSTIRQLREHVARSAIRTLPRRERRRALQIRKSRWWFDAAQDALSDGRYGDAVVAAARSVAASPATFTSPLVWPLFVRRLAGRLWHRLRGR